jgi:tetratricopeptide (TPR) repeat protein
VTETLPERGGLDAQPLAELLLLLYRKRFAGELVLRREAVEKRVFFRGGAPVMAESNLPSESLGIQLLDTGRITREDYARVVDAVQKRRCKEGAALLGLELVGPRELFEALKLQVRRRLLDCLGWTRGDFILAPGDPPEDEANAFRCDPVPLVQEGVAIHRSGAAIRASIGPRLDRWLASTPRTEAFVARLLRDTDVDRLLAGIDGPEPLGALLEGAGPSALAAAFVLEGAGAVVFRDRPPETDAARAEEPSLDIEVEVTGARGAEPAREAASRGAAKSKRSAAAEAEATALREEIVALHAQLDERDHYELLGVARNATEGQVRRAYFSAAKRFHPDVVTRLGMLDLRATAQAVFARIAEAHEVLTDAKRRLDYDRSLEAGSNVDASRLVQAEALFRKGEILLRAGNFAGALDFLRPCIALWPDEPAYQSALGWALYKKLPSEPKPAREALEQAIALDAQDAVAHFRLGMVLRALGDADAAQLALDQAKRLDPKVKS